MSLVLLVILSVTIKPWSLWPAQNDLRQQELPLARIKRIMKLDDEVKMISAEAPVLFSKAAEIFITELTLRAWIHTEDNKRRTLQVGFVVATSLFCFLDFQLILGCYNEWFRRFSVSVTNSFFQIKMFIFWWNLMYCKIC